jgi:uncharacterized LabA/DUF88 family protein
MSKTLHHTIERGRRTQAMERIAIFVDGANLFYAQRKLGWHLDFRKLYDFLTADHEVYNAFYYTSVTTPPDPGTESFLRALTAMGYTVRRKPIKEFTDQETGNVIRKANLDIEIVIDMFNTVDLYDVAVLASGDGDFERAAELLRTKGKRIVGLGAQAMAAYDLVNATDRYIFLEDIREHVEKAPVPLAAMSGAGSGLPGPGQDVGVGG